MLERIGVNDHVNTTTANAIYAQAVFGKLIFLIVRSPSVFSLHTPVYYNIKSKEYQRFFYCPGNFYSLIVDKHTKKNYNTGTMLQEFTIKPIAYIRSDFKEKFGIPRQSGRAPSLTAELVFLPEYACEEAFRGIEGFSHLWLIFDFSLSHREEFSPTVRPPRLGGNERVGVFASRSPFRPNPLGLSCVKLERVEKRETGIVLILSGADLLDGTPVLDVKPYLPFADCIENASAGYAGAQEHHRLQVLCEESLLEKLPKEKRAGLLECLADDPRPSYQEDSARVYGMRFGDWEIKFSVDENILRVLVIE